MTGVRTEENKADAKEFNSHSERSNYEETIRSLLAKHLQSESQFFLMAIPPNCAGYHELKKSSNGSFYFYTKGRGCIFYMITDYNQPAILNYELLPHDIKFILDATSFDQPAENPSPCGKPSLCEAIRSNLIDSINSQQEMVYLMSTPSDNVYLSSHREMYIYKEEPQNKEGPAAYFCYALGSKFYLNLSWLPKQLKDILEKLPFDQSPKSLLPCQYPEISQTLKNSFFESFSRINPFFPSNLSYVFCLLTDGIEIKKGSFYIKVVGKTLEYAVRKESSAKIQYGKITESDILKVDPTIYPAMSSVIKEPLVLNELKPFFPTLLQITTERHHTFDNNDYLLKAAVEEQATFLVKMILTKSSRPLPNLFPSHHILAQVAKFPRALLEIIYDYLFDEIENKMTELYRLAHAKGYYEIANLLSVNDRFNVSLTTSTFLPISMINAGLVTKNLRYVMQCLPYIYTGTTMLAQFDYFAKLLLTARDKQGNTVLMWLDPESKKIEQHLGLIQAALRENFNQLLTVENKKGETPYLRMVRRLSTSQSNSNNLIALLPQLLPPPTIDYLKKICDALITSQDYIALCHVLHSWHNQPNTKKYITNHLHEILGDHIPQLGMLCNLLPTLYFSQESLLICLAKAGVPFDFEIPPEASVASVKLTSLMCFARESKNSIESVYRSLILKTTEPKLIARFLQAWYELEEERIFPKSLLWNRETTLQVRLFPDDLSTEDNHKRLRDVIICLIKDRCKPRCIAEAAFWRVNNEDDLHFLTFWLEKNGDYGGNILRSFIKDNKDLSKIGGRLPIAVCLNKIKEPDCDAPFYHLRSMLDLIDKFEPNLFSYKYAETRIARLYAYCSIHNIGERYETYILNKILTAVFDNNDINHLLLFVECVRREIEFKRIRLADGHEIKPYPYQISAKLLTKGIISTKEQFSSALKLAAASTHGTFLIDRAQFTEQFLCLSPDCSKELLLAMLSEVPNLLTYLVDHHCQFAFDYLFEQLRKHLQENELFDIFNKSIQPLVRFVEYAESKGRKEFADKVCKALPKLKSAEYDTSFNFATSLNHSAVETQENDEKTFNFGLASFESANESSPIQTFSFLNSSINPFSNTSSSTSELPSSTSNPFSSTSNSASELVSSTSSNFTFGS